ncbi:MAG: glycerophosphodiester phosphodiesterase family protein [Deltaproteobacteria bacterium]|nr:glycerophosphodiester phosphodiesterase family protein [Deltaproteobacteria bacterium]
MTMTVVGQGKYSLCVTAHRGFSGRAPENTLAAFRAAIDAGCDMIELDVHLSRDREVVVIHDDDLSRTTDGRGKVADHVFAALRRLDAGGWFAPSFAGERIPSLIEVLELARGRILLNIELKAGKTLPYSPEELADRTLAACEKAGLLAQILFSSFAPAALDRIRERHPALPVALITANPWTSPEEPGQGKRYPTLSCRSATLNEANIGRAHAAGIRVHAWTVNAPQAMKRFIALGVDGIITNRPDRLIELLKNPADLP